MFHWYFEFLIQGYIHMVHIVQHTCHILYTWLDVLKKQWFNRVSTFWESLCFDYKFYWYNLLCNCSPYIAFGRTAIPQRGSSCPHHKYIPCRQRCAYQILCKHLGSLSSNFSRKGVDIDEFFVPLSKSPLSLVLSAHSLCLRPVPRLGYYFPIHLRVFLCTP